MRRVVEAAVSAARETGGLVDATLVDEIERAGYDRRPRRGADSLRSRGARARRRRARRRRRTRRARWRAFDADRRAGTVTPPAGREARPRRDRQGRVRRRARGHARGARRVRGRLLRRPAARRHCRGDRARSTSRARSTDSLHTFELRAGAVATSGIGRRALARRRRRPAHHLLDPATGRPAFTGVVQATALAPTAAEAEMRSKAALLSGPAARRSWLAARRRDRARRRHAPSSI